MNKPGSYLEHPRNVVLVVITSHHAHRYDNRCRLLSKEIIDEKLSSKEPFVLRLMLHKAVQSFQDLFNGEIAIDVGSIEGDPVIFKSDG